MLPLVHAQVQMLSVLLGICQGTPHTELLPCQLELGTHQYQLLQEAAGKLAFQAG